MYIPIKFIMRVRAIENIQLMPNIYEMLSEKSIYSLVMEKHSLLDMIDRFSPEVRC